MIGKWFSKEPRQVSRKSCYITRITETQEVDKEKWCYCQNAKGGDLIGYVTVLIAIEWFHISCLKIKKAPKGKWFCPSCHKKGKKQRVL